MAAEFLKMDYHFGIGGVVTFSNAKKLKEAVDYIPIEKILLETDSPYLAPVPMRGKRNEPAHVRFVNEKLAELKGVSVEEMARITCQNAFEIYTKTGRNANSLE